MIICLIQRPVIYILDKVVQMLIKSAFSNLTPFTLIYQHLTICELQLFFQCVILCFRLTHNVFGANSDLHQRTT